ncbi:hypothetical protein [Microcoleus sp. CAWBG58]|uniref:hypothetical protein n=1 Tax=Microcoleus sp. CAWBG58 TaxID=2841651 RepID=UPI0025F9D6D0|nr:hypothetical protein [Microcoleus sp. CAWBG58]
MITRRKKEEGRRKKEEGRRKKKDTASLLAIDILRLIYVDLLAAGYFARCLSIAPVAEKPF